MRAMLKGIAASDGVVCGPVYRLVDPDLSCSPRLIKNLDYELKRFHQALDAATSEVETIKTRVTKNLGADGAQVFCHQISMLKDPELVKHVEQIINEQRINAEVALSRAVEQLETVDQPLQDNPYLEERLTQLHQVTKRVTAHLLGVKLPDIALIDHPVILVAHELVSSEAFPTDMSNILGIITDLGGRVAHVSLLARAKGIPAVVGAQTATTQLRNGETVVMNGKLGNVTLGPSSAELYHAKVTMAKQRANSAKLAERPDHGTLTKDGVDVLLAANMETAADLPAIIQGGAEAVGLFRTEFLYMQTDSLPSEDEQFVAYRDILQKLAPRPVVMRTLDIGGDKSLPYQVAGQTQNSFLGARAIRQSLAHQQMFRSQLRALLRASAYGNLNIMFPMISTLDEFRQAKAIYNDERSQLTAANIPLGQIHVGMMIEVPAAAILADRFAQEVDFMSIGTNDLIGYTLAADRTDPDVAYLYQPYHPAVLRLIDSIIRAGHAAGIPVAMCGEMAGDPIAVPLLLGMGLDEFSMGANELGHTRELIGQLKAHDLASLVETVLNSASTSQEVITMVQAVAPNVVN